MAAPRPPLAALPLEPPRVPEMLVRGSKFIRWDEVSGNRDPRLGIPPATPPPGPPAHAPRLPPPRQAPPRASSPSPPSHPPTILNGRRDPKPPLPPGIPPPSTPDPPGTP